ncbi:MAG: hypothetical protein AAF587_22165 [Bacteroidota bacterium]
MKKDCLLLLICVTLSACTTTRPIPGDLPAPEQERITQSLFDSKDRSLSEENIQRLLDGTIILPDTVRISVFKYGTPAANQYYNQYWYNEEYLKVQQKYLDTLIAQIQKAEKVKRVVLMPSLMVSRSPTITELRESAVRLQTDLLLVFSLHSDIYYKYKAFTKDDAKAFATCETILMDIRTGVIPHSSVVTKENFTNKRSTDLSVDETRKRAETGAVIQTLLESGKGVADFLQQIE